MLTLTGKEIRDLACAAGFEVAECDDLDILESEMTITECPKDGVLGDDDELTKYNYIAYFSDYPEEGACPLGDALTD